MKRTWPKTVFRELADKWQVPTLILAVIVAGSALRSLLSSEKEHNVLEYVQLCQRFYSAEKYSEAYRLGVALLEEDGLDEPHRRRLHGIVARALYKASFSRTPQRPEDLQRIDAHLRASRRQEGFTAEEHLMMGEVALARNQLRAALNHYEWALEQGHPDRVKLLRRVLTILPRLGGTDEEHVYARTLDLLLADPALSGSDLAWAVGQKAERLFEAGKFSDAVELIADVLPRVTDETQRLTLEYAQAFGEYSRGQLDLAERALRSILDRMSGTELDARASLLLGVLCLKDDRPEEALAFLNGVILRHAHSAYHVAALLARAEALANVHRFESSQLAYEEAFKLLEDVGPNRQVSRPKILGSIRAVSMHLAKQGELDRALAFAHLEYKYIEQDEDDHTRHDVLSRIGAWHRTLATRLTARREKVASAQLAAELDVSVQRHYVQAGTHFEKLAQARGLSDSEAAEALWQAALAYRQASEPEKAGEIIERFVTDWPTNPHLQEALYHLGQSYQKNNRPGKAIERYRRLVAEYPRTPWGLSALVPMATCYMTMGRDHYGQAEAILRDMVDDTSHQQLLTPKAVEFRQALFLLGKLYYFQGHYDDCVARLGEALLRYPNDRNVPGSKFLIAQSYRKLGAEYRRKIALTNDRTRKDQLRRDWKNSMRQALQFYTQSSAALAALADRRQLEDTYLKLSYLYAADCLYDLGRYDEAILAYKQVTDLYEKDQLALAAYVQIINVYQRQGRHRWGKIKAVLERMRWLVQRLPDGAFSGPVRVFSREDWLKWIDWNYRSGLLRRGKTAPPSPARATSAAMAKGSDGSNQF